MAELLLGQQVHFIWSFQRVCAILLHNVVLQQRRDEQLASAGLIHVPDHHHDGRVVHVNNKSYNAVKDLQLVRVHRRSAGPVHHVRNATGGKLHHQLWRRVGRPTGYNLFGR